MWDVHDQRFGQPETRQRAIILPIGNDVKLGSAASAWRIILQDLTVNGFTVRQAVDDANLRQTDLQFDVYGNTTVKLK
jgi:hypothetical protein